jgi:activator of 2-hydroxyglutaryl-CoA dehydratase
MLSRIGVEDDVYFSGGVAKNIGMKTALEDVLKSKIYVEKTFDPQLTGALGAAVLARNFGSKAPAAPVSARARTAKV